MSMKIADIKPSNIIRDMAIEALQVRKSKEVNMNLNHKHHFVAPESLGFDSDESILICNGKRNGEACTSWILKKPQKDRFFKGW